MDCLPIQDIREIVRLLGEVAALSGELPVKRRALMDGLAKLVDADFWGWFHLRDQEEGNAPFSFMILLGGWDSEQQIMKFGEATTSDAAKPFNAKMRRDVEVHRTRRREDMFSDAEWSSLEMVRLHWEPAGLGESLSTIYPLGDKVYSSVVFLRRLGRPGFSPRDVCIAHLVTHEIDWLHREGTNVPAAAHVNDLSHRQRQVMFQVLSGDSVKQVARKLSMSAFTVNDHLKQIYRRFGVNSRGELLAQFLAGGPAIRGSGANGS
jgi:DNA-binding CsgD family transcriptional regulator